MAGNWGNHSPATWSGHDFSEPTRNVEISNVDIDERRKRSVFPSSFKIVSRKPLTFGWMSFAGLPIFFSCGPHYQKSIDIQAQLILLITMVKHKLLAVRNLNYFNSDSSFERLDL